MVVVKELILPEETIPTIVAIELIVIICFLFCWLLKRDAIKGGILCSALVAYCFLYLPVLQAIDSIWQFVCGNHVPSWIALSIYILLGWIMLPLVNRVDWHFGKYKISFDYAVFNRVFNIITIILVAINVAPFVTYHYRQRELAKHFNQKLEAPFSDLKLEAATTKPDIYYIILDGFADYQTLKKLWGFDNHALVSYLQAQGFYVVPEANSNYDRTEFSLGSSLNLQYINCVPDEMGKDWCDLSFFLRIIHNSVVAQLLKKNGYRFINISSAPNEYLAIADENVRSDWFNDFTVAVARFTPLYSTEDYVPLLRDMIAYHKLAPGNALPEVCAKPGPKFVLFHTDVSHAPCLFDENGNKRPLPKGHFAIDWGTPKEYFAQWQYTEKKAIGWIGEILGQPGAKPIVIIQSDHGPGIAFPNSINSYYLERMHILNAYYLPGHEKEGLYPTITPVNSFRVLLNDYFKTKLPLLPDRVYCAPDYARPFHWSELRNLDQSIK